MFTSNNTFTMFLIQLLFCIYFVVLQSNLFRCWKAYYAKRENGWKGKDKLVTEVTSGCWHSSVKFTFLSWGGQGEADGLWGTWELLFLECRGEGDDIEKFHILKKKKKSWIATSLAMWEAVIWSMSTALDSQPDFSFGNFFDRTQLVCLCPW